MVASEGPARPGAGELAYATPVERSGGEISAQEGAGSANARVSLEREAHVVALWEAIASTADHAETLEEASQECLDAVCHLTGWPVGHLYLVLDDDLVSTSIWHLQEPDRFAALRRATASTRLTIGRGLPGEVLATRQPVWIDDLSRHPNFPKARVVGELGVRSGFALPVILGSQVVAVLEFFSPTHVALDQALLDLVARVGSQLSRVAERRRAALRLASSDERLRRILDTANESFISMDSDGSVTEWNQCAESTFGWARHEVLGRSLAELLIPVRHREAHRRGVERFLATGEGKVVGTTIELTALHRRGHEIPIELAIWAFDEGGEWRFNALIRDISARKDAEARLRASERRLAEAQQVAGVGSWEWDLAANDVAWSEELYRIYGVAPEVTQASPTAFLDLVDVCDRPLVLETLGSAMASGTPFDKDFRINRPDGCLRVIHARGEVLWEAGQAVRMRGTARDVTERRRSEEELRGLRAALERAVEGMAQVDSLGRYLSVNEGYAAMCGARPQELIGRDWTSIVHPDDHEKVLAGHRQMVEVGRGVLEVSGVRLGGSQLDLRMVLVSSYDGDGRFVGHVCCMQDITARKRAEEELRNLLTRERQMVERLTDLDREKTDFVSCVSHELRTPLTSMLGFLEDLTNAALTP